MELRVAAARGQALGLFRVFVGDSEVTTEEGRDWMVRPVSSGQGSLVHFWEEAMWVTLTLAFATLHMCFHSLKMG